MSGATAPERLAVLGDPVEHSLSPQMHNAALQSLHLPYRYGRRRVLPADLSREFPKLRGDEYLGWNLTVPHKVRAVSLVDCLDSVAERLGAINTVVHQSGRLFGFNTDGSGLLAAINEAFACDLSVTRVAILGAGGGAGRAIARYLASLGVRHLLLINRTVQKANELGEELSASVPVEVFAWDRLDVVFANTDLVINATTLGLAGEAIDWPGEWLGKNHRVLDMVYGRGDTPLVLWARRHGTPAVDGLLMLLHQGVAAFELWFGKPAPREVMREALFRAAGR